MSTSPSTQQDQIPTQAGILEALDEALSSTDGPVELSAIWQRIDLTRFSGDRVHQNVTDAQTRSWARAWSPGGCGFAITSALEPDRLGAAVSEAKANSFVAEGKEIELPSSGTLSAEAFFEATADFNSSARAKLAGEIQQVVGPDADSHGNVRIATQVCAVANSEGLRTAYSATYAALNLVAQAEGRSTGYGGAIGRDVDALDFLGAAERARDIALDGREPVVLDPGRYEVLLDPPAVSMLLVSLGYVGLNVFGATSARAIDAWHRPGRRVGSDVLTLVDDPTDRAALFSPVDSEGTERSALTLIEGGESVGVAHDLTSAEIDGTGTTGHALHPGDKGPAPHSLTMPSGTKSRSELISGMKKGLIVNRIHPFVTLRGGPDGVLSGTTRDGVFLVENGEIVAPVANVRWSNSMTDLLGSLEAVSVERSVEFMDIPEFSPHTAHVPSLYATHFTAHGSQPRER